MAYKSAVVFLKAIQNEGYVIVLLSYQRITVVYYSYGASTSAFLGECFYIT